MKLEIEIPEPSKEDARIGWEYNSHFLSEIVDMRMYSDDYSIEEYDVEKMLNLLFKVAAKQKEKI